MLGLLFDEAIYELTSLIVGLLKDTYALVAHVALINTMQLFVEFNDGFGNSINSLISTNKILTNQRSTIGGQKSLNSQTTV